MEAFSGNIGSEGWAEELAYLQIDENNVEMTGIGDGNIEKEHATCPDNPKQVNCPSAKVELDVRNMTCILTMFKTTKDCNKKGK
jgi:hypothetical protein